MILLFAAQSGQFAITRASYLVCNICSLRSPLLVFRNAQLFNTSSASLAQVRFLLELLVGYAGPFRISEYLNVNVRGISISDSGCVLFFLAAKTISFAYAVIFL